MTLSPRAVIFDLDGTLIDSAPDIAWCVNERLSQDGMAPYPLEEVRLMIGGGVGKLIERAYQGRGVALDRPRRDQLTNDMIEIYSTRPAVDTRAYPGAGETLIRFAEAGCELGLCTNKPHAITMQILASFGWSDRFGAVVGGDTTHARKPDPAPMRRALEALGVDGEAAVVIGDSKADLGAGRSVGARVMLVAYGYSKTPVRELAPDWTIEGLGEAYPLLFPAAHG